MFASLPALSCACCQEEDLRNRISDCRSSKQRLPGLSSCRLLFKPCTAILLRLHDWSQHCQVSNGTQHLGSYLHQDIDAQRVSSRCLDAHTLIVCLSLKACMLQAWLGRNMKSSISGIPRKAPQIVMCRAGSIMCRADFVIPPPESVQVVSTMVPLQSFQGSCTKRRVESRHLNAWRSGLRSLATKSRATPCCALEHVQPLIGFWVEVVFKVSWSSRFGILCWACVAPLWSRSFTMTSGDLK